MKKREGQEKRRQMSKDRTERDEQDLEKGGVRETKDEKRRR